LFLNETCMDEFFKKRKIDIFHADFKSKSYHFDFTLLIPHTDFCYSKIVTFNHKVLVTQKYTDLKTHTVNKYINYPEVQS